MASLTQNSSGFLAKLSALVGAPEDALCLLISILLGFPLALIHRYTLYGQDPINQHLYFIICGVLLGFWNYGWSILHPIITVCVTYAIIKRLGSTKQCVQASFLFNMAYLFYGYLTTSTEDYDIKWTMPQCVLALRLIGLSFNVWDGSKPDSELSAFQKQTAIKEHPTLLEIAAFSFFPGSFLVGPQFSMKRYQDYVNNRLINKSGNSESLPDCIIPGIQRSSLGFVYLAFYQIGNQFFPEKYLLSSNFENLNFVQRCFSVGIWGRINLYKYISCWLMTEGVCTAFGLTYNGKDSSGNLKWDGCANVELLTFENATQYDHYIQSFNINTNHWSAEYVYKRLKFLGSKLYSQIATLAFLAVWHGFHSGYYMCFIMEFIIMYFEKDMVPVLKKHEQLQLLVKENFVARFAFWILLKVYTLIFMGYAIVPFVYLSYPKYMQVYGSIYYCGHVIFFSYPLLAPFIKKAIRQSRPRSHQE
ncbi:lysophospholipid acyltransferase 5 [Leptopilina boulardi]|uniref:lysophospholipid acyltransferase 5 n=1 Tax=Leptopilina boulardi TaxID=63433 RepID=UPI0021F523AC|nr:lysophospholipid acyltransferase 5 [Leptopilina boulardi]